MVLVSVISFQFFLPESYVSRNVVASCFISMRVDVFYIFSTDEVLFAEQVSCAIWFILEISNTGIKTSRYFHLTHQTLR